MDTAEILKKVRKIEIKTKELSKHLFAGEYGSAFKGRGMSFSEVKDYHYGDDIRNIDWNVTARTGDPYVKVYEEERELTVMFLVDLSRSSFFGTQQQFKSEMITEIVATLAFSALNNNDKVGAILFTDRVEKYLPPKKGRKHVLRIIRELINFEPQHGGTDLNEALSYLNHVIKKKSICFLLSDFFDRDYDTSIRLARRRHDLIGIRLHDHLEEELPDVGLMRIRDAETGAIRVIDTASRQLRAQYAEAYQAREQYFNQAFRKSGASAIDIRTDSDYVKHLLKFFKNRHK